jgi:hypothetical protein
MCEVTMMRRSVVWRSVTAVAMAAAVAVPLGVGSPVAAACATTAPSGLGSTTTPYQVASAANLLWLSDATSETSAAHWAKNYVQTADIDLAASLAASGCDWSPIGDSTTQFTGTYDGGGFTISNLEYNETNDEGAALFRHTDGATLRNVTLSNFVITSSEDATGALVGHAVNTTILDVTVTNADIEGTLEVGGLVGLLDVDPGADITIERVMVSGSVESTDDWVGGAIGKIEAYGTGSGTPPSLTISDSSSSAGVIAGDDQAGGFIGTAAATQGATLTLTDIVSSGDVTGSSLFAAGGLIGYLDTLTAAIVTIDGATASGKVEAQREAGGAFGRVIGDSIGSGSTVGLTIRDVHASGHVTTTEEAAGGLIGTIGEYSPGYEGSVIIEDVSAEGIVSAGAPTSGAGSGKSFAGGLIGKIYTTASTSSVSINRAFHMNSVEADRNYAGGLIGQIQSDNGSVTVSKSFAASDVTLGGSTTSVGYFGGLIGAADTVSPGTVSVLETSAWGDVSNGTGAGSLVDAAGLIGSVATSGVTVEDSFAIGSVTLGRTGGGGLVDAGAGTWTDSFWDTERSGMSTSGRGTGKTTAEMQSFATFSSIWSIAQDVVDPAKTWFMCGAMYPVHSWIADQLALCLPGAPSGVSVSGVDGTASVSWTAASVVGADPVGSYTVTASPGGASCTATAPAVTCDVTGLSVGTSYTFSVTASNTVGAGPAAVSAAFEMTATPAPATTAPATTAPATTAPATTAPATTVPETTVPAEVPVRDADGNLPSVSDPSKATMVVNGVVSFLDVTVVDETRLVVSGDGFEMALAGSNTAGESSRAGDSGRLEVTDGGLLQVSGTGFDPGSEVDIWVMSDPVFAGTVTVGADGSFAGSVPVPEGLVVGPHTVQANGVTADGVARSLNLGIELVSAAVLPATGGSFPVAPVMVLLLAAGAVLVVTARRRSIV